MSPPIDEAVVRTLSLMSVSTLFEEAVAGEQAVAAQVIVDLAHALEVMLAECVSMRKALVWLQHAFVRDLWASAAHLKPR